MSCQNFDLSCNSSGDFAIFQGATYNCVTFYYQDIDLSSYSAFGQIRNCYAEDGGEVLATFSFEPLVFGSVTVGLSTFDATIIQPRLTASQTQGIPATLQRSSTEAALFPGVTGWTYDIKLIDPSETVIVVRGLVEVIKDTSRVVVP